MRFGNFNTNFVLCIHQIIPFTTNIPSAYIGWSIIIIIPRAKFIIALNI